MKYRWLSFNNKNFYFTGKNVKFSSKRLNVCINTPGQLFKILLFLILSNFSFATYADKQRLNEQKNIFQCNAMNIQAQQRSAPGQLISSEFKKTDRKHKLNLASVKQYTYKIINQVPHDINAFTQGLVFYKNNLYESTGLLGQSKIRKLDINTGRVMQQNSLPNHLFGEGLSINNHQLVQLTWKSERIITYRLDNLKKISEAKLNGEAWGLTSINNRLLVSDGSAILKWPNDNKSKPLTINENGMVIQGANELEYANGFIYANIWPTDCVAKIDLLTGSVKAWINLSGLYPENLRPHWTAILNGIAYHKDKNNFFVTGKYWPYIYELELQEVKQKSKTLKLAGSADSD